jgi:hypothetical protein
VSFFTYMVQRPGKRRLRAFARSFVSLKEQAPVGLVVERHPTLSTREQLTLHQQLWKLGYVGVLVLRGRPGGRPLKWTDQRLAALLAGADGEDLKPSTRRRLISEAKRRGLTAK